MNLFLTVICLPEAAAGELSPRDYAELRKALPGVVLLPPDAMREPDHRETAPGRPGKRAQDWTAGLRIRTANALRAHGFTSRQQVAQLSQRRLRSIPNIGADSHNWAAPPRAFRRAAPPLTGLPLRRHRACMMVWLVLAAILYRGLIPAGFMPAVGAAGHGGMLVECPHGDMAMHAHGKKGAGSAMEQCPFGAAGAPAMTSGGLALAAAAPMPLPAAESGIPPGSGRQPRLQPPVRGPPAVS